MCVHFYVFKLTFMSAVFIGSILQQVRKRDPEWKKFNVRYCYVTQLVLIQSCPETPRHVHIIPFIPSIPGTSWTI